MKYCETIFLTLDAWLTYASVTTEIGQEPLSKLGKDTGFLWLQLVDNSDGGMVFHGDPVELK